MISWEFIESAPVPGSDSVMDLMRRGREMLIRVDGRELMGNRAHGSEDALADLAFDRLRYRPGEQPPPRVLVGGLGAGFTLAAALRRVGPDGQVIVAELVPAVIRWNADSLGEEAGFPVRDPRTLLYEGDVADRIRSSSAEFDAILLDVDNGPESLSTVGNSWLYFMEGLEATRAALRPYGVLGVWSADPDRAFARRFARAGFDVETIEIRSRGNKGGRRHIVFLGTPTEDRPQLRERLRRSR